MKRFQFLLAAAALAVGAIAPTASALAQEFPNRPIKFIVPFPPGSGTDTSARYFGRKLTELTGQPVVVENKPGANGFIAVQAVLSAPADGYTVFVGSNSTLAVNVALFRKLPYNPQTDFAPLSMMMRAPTVVVVPPQSPYKSLAELVAAAKAQPGKLNHGGGSAGYQLMNEALNDRAGIDIRNIPFKGASEALTAVAAGTVLAGTEGWTVSSRGTTCVYTMGSKSFTGSQPRFLNRCLLVPWLAATITRV